MRDNEEQLEARIQTVLPILNERQRRIYLAAEAKSIGRGGKAKVARLSAISAKTISNGEKDSIELNESENSRIRKKGGGRKKTTTHFPDLLKSIEDIVFEALASINYSWSHCFLLRLHLYRVLLTKDTCVCLLHSTSHE